ncbi:MAG TPA: hypothetical protein VM638_01380, partial [Actinomycetota bacterium]|nr:hypothetical protein [Actinomycetota bacterium]
SWAVATSWSDRGAPTEARARTGAALTNAQGAATASGAQPGEGTLRDMGGADRYESDSDTTALSQPFTERTKGAIFSSAQGSVAGNSAALLHDRDAGRPDTFVLTPTDAACLGTRGEGIWRDCGAGAGIGIVDDDARRLRTLG